MQGQNIDDVHEMQKPVEELQERCAEFPLPGEQDAECPQFDWTAPPKVTWRSEEDAAGADDPDDVRFEVEVVLCLIWKDIPEYHKAVLCVDMRYVNLAYVPGDVDPVDPVRDSMANKYGGCRPGPGVTLNIATLERCENWDHALIYTLAHELAHAVIMSQRRDVAKHARELLEGDLGGAFALRAQYEEMARYQNVCDPLEPEGTREYEEVLADCLALSWGIEEEIVYGCGMEFVEGTDMATTDSTIMPVLMKVHHAITRRLAERNGQ